MSITPSEEVEGFYFLCEVPYQSEIVRVLRESVKESNKSSLIRLKTHGTFTTRIHVKVGYEVLCIRGTHGINGLRYLVGEKDSLGQIYPDAFRVSQKTYK